MYELKKAIEELLTAKDVADVYEDCGNCAEPIERLRLAYDAVKDKL